MKGVKKILLIVLFISLIFPDNQNSKYYYIDSIDEIKNLELTISLCSFLTQQAISNSIPCGRVTTLPSFVLTSVSNENGSNYYC